MRVLVASEDAGERSRATAAMHARADFEVVEATSASDAHRRLLDADVDVVVMDGDMRPEGGYSVTYELRAAAELAREHAPPVIMLIDRDQDRWLADWAGAADSVLKPVDPFDLADRVKQLQRLIGGGGPATSGQPGGARRAAHASPEDAPPELDREDARQAP